jgi:hypothetical protein
MLRPKSLPLAAGLCFLAAVELLAQGGLGAPPGQIGGGTRSGSSGRAPAPSARIPEAAAPPSSNSGETGAAGVTPANRPQRAAPSRPVGSILTPGSPGGSSSRSGSQAFPGFLGQPNILSPGKPGPYRPGNVITPGTPPAPATGGIFAGSSARRDRSGDSGGHRGHDRARGGGVVYPYVYFGYPYAYGNGGYAIDTGAVSRTSPTASYAIEGHLDEPGVQGRSRVYEVGPGFDDDTYAAGDEPVDSDLPEESAGQESATFDLIALQGGLIYAVQEHWLLGNTVHFVTLQGDHYVVTLQEVDLDLSVRLNRERGRRFVLEVRAHDGRAPQGTDVAP